MTRRIWAAASAAVLVCSLAGCSDDSASGSAGSTTATTDGAPAGAPAPSGATTTKVADTSTSTSAVTSTTTASTAPGDNTVPGATWATVTPAAAGFDETKLDAVAAKAQKGGSICMAVTRNGQLVKDWYFNGANANTSQEIFSATKSVTSTLVGLAQAKGLLSIDDKASKYIPQWSTGDAAKITVKDLLSNDSGRHYDPITDYVTMATKEKDKTAFAIGLTQDKPPGAVWAYNNSAIQTLSQVLEQAVKGDPVAWTKANLLDPIGMTHSFMRDDPSGHMLTFMGMHSTCTDMARFGLLFMRQGRWGSTQVLPAQWVHDATHTSQPLNPRYGYLWWLNTASAGTDGGQATGASTTVKGGKKMVPGAPDDAFFALGMGNQVVSVIPSRGIVAVRIGSVNQPAPFGVRDLTEGTLAALTG